MESFRKRNKNMFIPWSATWILASFLPTWQLSILQCCKCPTAGSGTAAQTWRMAIFIDASKLSLKAVLLHNSNEYPSVTLAYGAYMKELYKSMKLLLNTINYNKYKWHICGVLKVIALLLGLLLGYTKFSCSCVNGTVGTVKITTSRKTGRRENHSLLEKRT